MRLGSEGWETVTVDKMLHCDCGIFPAKMVVVNGGNVVVARQLEVGSNGEELYAESTKVEMPDV